MFIIFLIGNELSCGKVENLVFIRSDGISKCFLMLRAVFFYTSSSKDLNTLHEHVCKNTPCMISTLI